MAKKKPKKHSLKLTLAEQERVNFFLNKQDFQVAVMGGLGFSNKFIRRETDLSDGQIHYRLKKAGVRRQDYRDGISKMAIQINTRIPAEIGPVFARALSQHMRCDVGYRNGKLLLA